MIVSLLIGLFIFLSFILGIFVLLQQGKGDMGLGALHSGGQTLFGGSGGQTFFEKLTWFLGAIFMGGALLLTVMRMNQLDTSRITVPAKQVVAQHIAPEEAPAPNENAS